MTGAFDGSHSLTARYRKRARQRRIKVAGELALVRPNLVMRRHAPDRDVILHDPCQMPPYLARRTMTNLRGFWKEQGSSRPRPAFTTHAEKTRAKKAAKKKAKKERKKLLDSQWLAFGGVVAIGAPHPDYRQGDDSFYKSREWRALRYVALKNCAGGCQCCGAMAADGAKLHVDHIVPRYKAPHLSLDIRNLQVLCEDCNIGKGGWDDTNWRQHWKSI